MPTLTKDEQSQLRAAVERTTDAKTARAAAQVKLDAASGEADDAQTRLAFLLLVLRDKYKTSRGAGFNYVTGEITEPGAP